MEKNITSDKVGQFVQTLYESGKFDHFIVRTDHIAVKKEEDYFFVKIIKQTSYEDVLKFLMEEE